MSAPTKRYPSAADAELQRLMSVWRSQPLSVAMQEATDALADNVIGCGDYLWLVRWTEGRA
jgi:hypothetical protein